MFIVHVMKYQCYLKVIITDVILVSFDKHDATTNKNTTQSPHPNICRSSLFQPSTSDHPATIGHRECESGTFHSAQCIRDVSKLVYALSWFFCMSQ